MPENDELAEQDPQITQEHLDAFAPTSTTVQLADLTPSSDPSPDPTEDTSSGATIGEEEFDPLTPEEMSELLDTLGVRFPDAARNLSRQLEYCARKLAAAKIIISSTRQQFCLSGLDSLPDLDTGSEIYPAKAEQIIALRNVEECLSRIATFLQTSAPSVVQSANVAETGAAAITQLQKEYLAGLCVWESDIQDLTQQLQTARQTSRAELLEELRLALDKAKRYMHAVRMEAAQKVSARDQEIQQLRAQLAAANATIHELRKTEEPAAGTAAKRSRPSI